MRIFPTLDRVPAPLLALVAIILIQLGSGTAKSLMVSGDPLSLLFLRLAIGTLLLTPFLPRRLAHLNRRMSRDAVLLGITYAALSVSVYWALQNLPLGLVATFGFLGPISISVLGAKSAIDYVWSGLAVIGVALLSPLAGASAITTLVLLCGLGYALIWAIYILVSASAAKSLPGLTGFALAMPIATLLVAPFGLPGSATFLDSPQRILPLLTIGCLSTYPFAMEYLAMRRIPPRIYGVLLSLEPGIAAIMGLLLLGEYLTGRGIIAVLLVTLASLGATLLRPTKTSGLQLWRSQPLWSSMYEPVRWGRIHAL